MSKVLRYVGAAEIGLGAAILVDGIVLGGLVCLAFGVYLHIRAAAYRA